MPQIRRSISTTQRRNTSPSHNPEDLVVKGRGLPSEAVKLTAAERKLLSDPDWITEDEADTIISRRIMRKEGHLAKPIQQYLRERGIRMDD